MKFDPAQYPGQYSWAKPRWQQTIANLDKLHHALLITGVSGVAKREFAIALSQHLLCDAASAERGTCGQCRHCALFAAGTHPDFHVLTTEQEWQEGRIELISKYCDRYQDIAARDKRTNPSRIIPVDQVRLLGERFYTHPHLATRRVTLIVPAERMNTNAANALLKLLEEPPANSILILLSSLPGYLPATIRSRCLQIGIPLPNEESARAWLTKHIPEQDAVAALRHANGAPLDALALQQSDFLPLHEQLQQNISELASGKIAGLELAAKLLKHDFLQVLNWLHKFNCDIIKAHCGVASTNHHDSYREIAPADLSAQRMFALYDKIGNYRKIAREQINEQLAMEEVILTLQAVVRG